MFSCELLIRVIETQDVCQFPERVKERARVYSQIVRVRVIFPAGLGLGQLPDMEGEFQGVRINFQIG